MTVAFLLSSINSHGHKAVPGLQLQLFTSNLNSKNSEALTLNVINPLAIAGEQIFIMACTIFMLRDVIFSECLFSTRN